MSPESRRFASLQQALDAHRIPTENHDLIKTFTEAVGIEGFYDRAGYINAVRHDGEPALEIHYGYTNGFRSPEEASHPGITERPWKSTRGWGVTHPEHKLRDANTAGKQEREARYRPRHGYQLNALGECDACA